MSTTLVIIGLARCLLWAIAFVVACIERERLLMVGFGMATVSSAFFAFENAGWEAPHGLLSLFAVWATPAVAFIVGGYIHKRIQLEKGKR
jgi:Na+-transporting NADH:ubiquinone oxidoreductase subunit NqrD